MVDQRSWAVRWVVVWVAVGPLLAFADRPLWDRLWIMTLGIWVLYAALGLALFVRLLWRARGQSWRGAEIVPALAVPVFSIALWFLFPHLAGAGDRFQFHRRFDALRPQYERIVGELSRTQPPPKRGELEGISFTTDAGPPLRVAFLQPGGMIDNWEGLIYDPTGAVGTATGWRAGVPGEFSASPEVIKLFGGDLVGCRHIIGPFYRCWFT